MSAAAAVAVAVTVSCPPCAKDVNTQAGTYAFARAYLCALHQSLWDSADEREHGRGKGCPHAPRPCGRCGVRP